MQDQPTLSPVAPQMAIPSFEKLLLPLALLLGLALRLYQASTTYLNPDEAWILDIAWPEDWAARSRQVHHPPIVFLLLHYLHTLNSSEVFLRLPSVLSGSLFPWVVWKWLQHLQFPRAAAAALLVLEFSPNLIALSAQLRGYTLALLFAASALYFLELALEKRSLLNLALFTTSLYLAILSEFSVAFAALGLGLYALLRLLSQLQHWRFALLWATTQFGALGLYFYLFTTSVASLLGDPNLKYYIEGYLSPCFPQPGRSRLAFASKAILHQFHYLASSTPMGWLLALLFPLGLFLMWRGFLPNAAKAKLRPLSIALLLTLGTALIAALAKIHPLGPTRHNIILALFTIIPSALAIEGIFHRFPRLQPLALPSLAAATLGLFVLAVPDPQNIHPNRHSLESMHSAIQQIQDQIPKGSLILMDEETAWILSYYLERKPNIVPGPGAPQLRRYLFSSYRAYGLNWFFDSFDTINQDLATLRRLENIPPTQPIYVLDAGFGQLPPAIWNARELSPSMLLLLPQ